MIKEPVWRSPEVPGYLFLGGLAGASSLLAAFAQAVGDDQLAKVSKTGAAAAISLSGVALVADLGRPARFLNMLRVFKVTSPMSVGSWVIACYGPLAAGAAGSALTGWLPRLGALASAGAAVLGAGVGTYTAALLCDTAVPAWHEAHREMPYLFAGSAAGAAGGLGMLVVGPEAAAPAVRFAVLGATTELAAKRMLLRRLGDQATPYHSGTAGRLLDAAEVLTIAGLSGATASAVGVGLRNRAGAGAGARAGVRAGAAASGLALLAASALTRFGVFEAGLASARDPAYTVRPQRKRLRDRLLTGSAGSAGSAGQAAKLRAGPR